MYALIENNNITQTYNNPRGMTIGGVQYPQNIHSLWSESDLNAIGIYTVVYDNTNKKNDDWYTNTDQTLTFADGVVTAAYGTATAKAIEGLKTIKKEQFDKDAEGLLSKYDWYIIRNTEAGTAIPSAITDYRTAIRAKCNSMQAQIDGAANVDALAALYEYAEDPRARPLGEWPVLEV